ncbi:hypothetical protein RRG08_045293 [Elysia crispata]|uniref:Uncharacterized protein n=1 Tax=Elysia crispata TaxID=231223 RepID=A0AAE1A3E5_9GAST|nr:hypothetical protein RRG08_045293 [Elysia crispata]
MGDSSSKPKVDLSRWELNPPPTDSFPKNLTCTVAIVFTQMGDSSSKPKVDLSRWELNPPPTDSFPKNLTCTVAIVFTQMGDSSSKPKVDLSRWELNPPPTIAQQKMRLSLLYTCFSLAIYLLSNLAFRLDLYMQVYQFISQF